MIQPNISHMPCDLNQQRKRADARKDSIARAVAWHNGRRSLVDRLLRSRAPIGELSAEDLHHGAGEDVYHGFRV